MEEVIEDIPLPMVPFHSLLYPTEGKKKAMNERYSANRKGDQNGYFTALYLVPK